MATVIRRSIQHNCLRDISERISVTFMGGFYKGIFVDQRQIRWNHMGMASQPMAAGFFFLYCDNVSHNFSHRAIDASSRMAATFFWITLETKG